MKINEKEVGVGPLKNRNKNFVQLLNEAREKLKAEIMSADLESCSCHIDRQRISRRECHGTRLFILLGPRTVAFTLGTVN